MTSHRQSGRAVELLRIVDATGWFDHEALARELVVSEAQLAGYFDETIPMPLDRQLCLALFVIEKVPSLARHGHRLRGQVSAALAFNARDSMPSDLPPFMPR